MPMITTKAPLPTDTAALKQYRVSSRGNQISHIAADGLKVQPEAGWYLFEWHVRVESSAETNGAQLRMSGGGLRSQNDINSEGSATLHSNTSWGTSISIASDNSIAASYDRTAQGSLVMFLDGTMLRIWSHSEEDVSILNQFVFTRFAFPNGNDLGA